MVKLWIHEEGSWISDPEFYTAATIALVHPVADSLTIEHPASTRMYRGSSIQHPATAYRDQSVAAPKHHSLGVRYRASGIEHPASSLQHRSHRISHP